MIPVRVSGVLHHHKAPVLQQHSLTRDVPPPGLVLAPGIPVFEHKVPLLPEGHASDGGPLHQVLLVVPVLSNVIAAIFVAVHQHKVELLVETLHKSVANPFQDGNPGVSRHGDPREAVGEAGVSKGGLTARDLVHPPHDLHFVLRRVQVRRQQAFQLLHDVRSIRAPEELRVIHHVQIVWIF